MSRKKCSFNIHKKKKVRYKKRNLKMNAIVITAAVLFVVLLLSAISCSTKNDSLYYRNRSNALYSVMKDASESLKLAKNASLPLEDRRANIERAIAFLDAAERFLTPMGINRVVNIDSLRMRNACIKLQSRLLSAA